jgi:uncharacterized protein YdgA (DUF945 family)
VKKSVIALILLAVLIIIVSPGIVGKLAENSVGENLNWAARESGELVVTSEAFDRGWFSSEGQHRVTLGDGQLRTVVESLAGDADVDQLPVLLINTHIDHGLIAFSSMGREEGSLAPGLGRAVSTLAVELGDGEVVNLPGTIYSKVGIAGHLDSHYILEAGSTETVDGKVTWEPTRINVVSSPSSGDIDYDGKIGAMTFGDALQLVAIDGVTFAGEQQRTSYGFNVGSFDMNMGTMTATAGGMPISGMQGLTLKASSSLDGELVAAAMRMEMSGQKIPNFGDVSVIADMNLTELDAAAMGVLSKRLKGLGSSQDPNRLLLEAEAEFKQLFAAGFNVSVNQLDVGLPMGTVETKMTFNFPAADRADFAWTSLLLSTVAQIDLRVPEALVQLATSMNPQAGAIVGMGYLKKEGDVYVMDAEFKKGLLTVNGAPIPIPLGAFQ